MAERQESITLLLGRWRSGDLAAAELLLPLVYNELRGLADSYLQRERHVSICRTELVHELYLKLRKDLPEFENRSHFFGIAARLMRQILVDLVRKRKAQRRRSPTTMPLAWRSADAPHRVDVLILDQCLDRLEKIDPRKAALVELKSFGGMTIDEMALALDLSPATVKREWSVARLWLRRELDRSSKIGESSSDGGFDPGSRRLDADR